MTSRPSAMATGIVDWATRAPERTAVIDVHRTLTVGELDAAAAALAARLLDGAGPRDADEPSWLPIVVDRSVSTVVAIHGAIRAGLRVRAHRVDDAARAGRGAARAPREPTSGDRRATRSSPSCSRTASRSSRPSGTNASVLPHRRPSITRRRVVCSSRPARPDARRVWSPRGRRSTRSCRARWRSARVPAATTWTEGFVQQFGAGAALRAVALPCVGRTVCIADPTAMSIDELLDWLDANQVDSVSFAADRCRTRSSESSTVDHVCPRCHSFRSTSEAAHWSLVAPLRRLVGPHLTIRAGYAASEVGLIAHLDIGPDDPIGEGRIPLGGLEPGVEVRLEPLDGRPLDDAAGGRAASHVGISGRSRAHREPVLHRRGAARVGGGAHDIVRVDDVGMYHHLGRADEMVKVKGALRRAEPRGRGAAEHRRNRRRRGDAAPRRERLGPRRRPRAGRRRHAHARARRCRAAANDCHASSCPPSWCVTTSCRGPSA